MTIPPLFAIILLMLNVASFAQSAGELLDAAGVIVIISGAIISTLAVMVMAFNGKGLHNLYRSYRHNLARSILIGLEFLVAGDIIRSVAGNLTFDSVIILAVIVAIRSLLGMEFDMEIEGHWPWQRSKSQK